MGLTSLKTKEDFDSFIKNNTRVAVDFTATWCPPCKMVGPIFEKMAEKFPNVKLVKVDVDENSETSESCGISAMPTFMFYFNGNEETGLKVVGANVATLEQSLEKLSKM